MVSNSTLCDKKESHPSPINFHNDSPISKVVANGPPLPFVPFGGDNSDSFDNFVDNVRKKREPPAHWERTDMFWERRTSFLDKLTNACTEYLKMLGIRCETFDRAIMKDMEEEFGGFDDKELPLLFSTQEFEMIMQKKMLNGAEDGEYYFFPWETVLKRDYDVYETTLSRQCGTINEAGKEFMGGKLIPEILQIIYNVLDLDKDRSTLSEKLCTLYDDVLGNEGLAFTGKLKMVCDILHDEKERDEKERKEKERKRKLSPINFRNDSLISKVVANRPPVSVSPLPFVPFGGDNRDSFVDFINNVKKKRELPAHWESTDSFWIERTSFLDKIANGYMEYKKMLKEQCEIFNKKRILFFDFILGEELPPLYTIKEFQMIMQMLEEDAKEKEEVTTSGAFVTGTFDNPLPLVPSISFCN
jgi:hypothetical protein